jgi:hypothetical protein
LPEFTDKTTFVTLFVMLKILVILELYLL